MKVYEKHKAYLMRTVSHHTLTMQYIQREIEKARNDSVHGSK